MKLGNVLTVGNNYTYHSTLTNVSTDKDVLLFPPTEEQLSESATQQLPIAPTKTTTHTCTWMLITSLLTQVQLHMFVQRTTQHSFLCNLLEHLHPNFSQLYKDDPIKVYGIRRVYYRCQGQPVVIPYFACDVKYPIISVSRLIDRGYDLYSANTGTILRGRFLKVTLKRDGNLLYLPAEPQVLDEGWKIQTITTPDGQVKFQKVQPKRINKVIIAPTSATSTGARPIMGGNTDIWIVKGNYVSRVHKRLRRAKVTPENTQSSTYRAT